MGGVVVLPLRVSRNHSTSVECNREATFGKSSWPTQPPRWSSRQERLRRALRRRSPLRRRSTTRSTRDIITSVTMSRSSRRSHSPVTPPSGEATIGLRTSVRRPIANDTRHELSGHLWPRVELARHNAREPGTNTLGSRIQFRMRSTPNRFGGVSAPRTTPSTRPGTGNVDSPLR